jgi:hypothetical protein
MIDDDLDLAHRELCPDGACIGVIGSDGRCRECGAVAASSLTHARNRGLVPVAIDDPAELGAREPCPDEGCIGVIGADGRCPECGASASANAPHPRTDAAGGRHRGDDLADDFAARDLCPEGACIGLIGADGRCKICGATKAA